MASPKHDFDLAIIGAGTAGIAVAANAAPLGARVLLADPAGTGGVRRRAGPGWRAALLAAAEAAKSARAGWRLGVSAAPKIDFPALKAHLDGHAAELAALDAPARLAGLGVEIRAEAGRFAAPERLLVGVEPVAARRIVLATGSSPALPAIEGLAEAAPWTADSIAGMTALPGHLMIIGADAAAVELAAGIRALGAEVTLIHDGPLLPEEEPEAVAVLERGLAADGVTLVADAVRQVEPAGDGIALTLAGGQRLPGTQLLVSAGRRPRIDGLGLDLAGIAHDAGGITVDARQLTSHRRAFAVGGCCGPLGESPAAAGHQAEIVIRNALFKQPAKLRAGLLPRLVLGWPELAAVGATEAELKAAGRPHRVLRQALAENERALAGRLSGGFVKLLSDPGGALLGATIVGRGAGELIAPVALALSEGLKVTALGRMLTPDPTLASALRRAAAGFLIPTLTNDRTRSLVRFLSSWG